MDPKSRLHIFISRELGNRIFPKEDFSVDEVGPRFTCTLKLLLSDQSEILSVTGQPKSTKKEAQKSAAEAFLSDVDLVNNARHASKQASKLSATSFSRAMKVANLLPQATTLPAPMGTSSNYKSQVHEWLTQQLRSTLIPEYSTVPPGQSLKYVSTLKLYRERVLVLEVTGTVMSTKKSAEQSAARVLMTNEEYLSRAKSACNIGYAPKVSGSSFASAQATVIPTNLPAMAQDPESFKWNGLITSGRIPKDFQIVAFQRALAKNTIVVVPTGEGKTLIGAMVMHRLRLLNPNKLTVMVVERVPLVFQQAKSIASDTSLAVCHLSGDTKDSLTMERLFLGRYDALVVTAGLFIKMLGDRSSFEEDSESVESEALSQDVEGIGGTLRLEQISVMVFDECHHAGKGHLFASILARIERCPQPMRPRLVGLTASPICRAKTPENAKNELKQLSELFLDADIFRPAEFFQAECVLGSARRIECELSIEQLEHGTILEDELWMLIDLVKASSLLDYANDALLEAAKVERCSCERSSAIDPQVTAFIALSRTTLQSENCQREMPERELGQLCETVERLSGLLFQIEVNYLLGPTFCEKELTQAEMQSLLLVDSDIAKDRDPEAVLPPCSTQLRQLVKVIAEFMKRKVPASVSAAEKEEEGLDASIDQSNPPRILVFVERKDIAQRLKDFLELIFPPLESMCVVGQGGGDGMKWGGTTGQSAVLEQFRVGRCQLLVSTSVLEEGLDVQACNLVIRFGGQPSLVRLMQSKGRARAVDAEFVLIYTPSERCFYEAAQRREANVNAAIRAWPTR